MRLFITVLAFLTLASGSATAETAIFAGGCFWCMDAEFNEIPGVTKVVSGFTGGHTSNPTYEEVSTGETGHFESIEVTFDPAKVSYAKLLNIFWHNVDPTDDTGQFCDKGSQYHAGIFYQGETQKALAEASLVTVEKLFNGQKVAIIMEPAGPFYPAEDHHQDFYKKNALHYTLYHQGCGRDKRLNELWNGKPATLAPGQ